MRIHPSATSSGVSALLTRIVTVPSVTSAMHVAQLPCSHEYGGFSEARRAASSTVSPGTCSSTWRLRLIVIVSCVGCVAASARFVRRSPSTGSSAGFVAPAIDDRVDEAFDGDVVGRDAGVERTRLDEVHERRRAADEHVRVGAHRCRVEERRRLVGR